MRLVAGFLCFPLLFAVLYMLIVGHTLKADAAMLSRVSDTISTSWPSSTSTSHTILFTVPTTIPVGGKFTITPEATGGITFDIPAALDYTDLDLAIDPTAVGAFTDRTLAATPSATEEGVAVVSGSSGSITITLGSGGASPITAGSVVRVIVGGAASFGGAGDQFITSPSAIGSYHIRLVTLSALDVQIDYGSTLIAIIAPVTVGPIDTTDAVPPLRSNGLPSGLLPGSTANVLVSFNTDKLAVCRYATSSGVTYASMTATFPSYNIGLLHYESFAVAQNTVYNFYIRCVNTSGRANTDDYLIAFEVGVVPSAEPPPPPPPSFGGGPSGVGGGGLPGGQFLQSGDVTVEGRGVPGGSLVVLQDGKIARETTVSSLGSFSEQFRALDRGTYTWGVYLRDANGRLSSTYTSTIYLTSGTNNIIAPIYISPTMNAASTTVALGGPIQLRGYAIALAPVQVLMNKQGDALSGKIVSATTTSNGNGSWSLTIPTEGLTKGTYEIKALSQVSARERSLLSPIVYVGLGENPNPNFRARSDINDDNRVNLTDLSILLYNWKTNDPAADINRDGIVNLTDFSILLVNWTG